MSRMNVPARSSQYTLVTVALGVLCAILLTAAIILGVYINKGSGEHFPLHQNMTQITRELMQLRANYTAVIHIKEKIEKQLDEIVAEHLQIQLLIEQQKQTNDLLEFQMSNLSEQNNHLKSNISPLEESCGLCLSGWDLHMSKCYYFAASVYPLKNWKASRDDCVSHGADLVVIDSREKQLYITNALLAINFNSGGLYQKGFYIGLREAHSMKTWGRTEGIWTWVHDSELSEGFWMNGEPNDADGGEDCAATYPTRNPSQSWNDVPCSHPLRWICEMAQQNTKVSM